ncbi:hypothetical protein ACHAWF_002672 [Thalassiosira exigua]
MNDGHETPSTDDEHAGQATKKLLVTALLCFLTGGAVVFAVFKLTGSGTSNDLSKTNTNPSSSSAFDREEPVVIVGGGLAGTYAAWRLSSADDSGYGPDDIHLYERTDRISGRLLSPPIGGDLCNAKGEQIDMSHVPRAELGGMRFKTTHRIVAGLVDALGIETGPFYLNANNETVSEPGTNPMFARNVLGTRNDFLNEGNQIPFARIPKIKENPMLSKTYEYDPCDGASNKNIFLEPFDMEGEPLYSYSLQESNDLFSGDGDWVSLRDAISGYNLENAEIGAGVTEFLELLPHEEYVYRRPLEGMSSIPLSLHGAAVKLGVTSSLNQEVTEVEELEEGIWHVTLRETKTSPCTGITTIKKNGTVTVVRTQRVILAIPGAALKRVEFVQPNKESKNNEHNLDTIINKLADQVTGVPLMKIFAAWPTRWWNTVNNLDTFSAEEQPKLVPPGRSTNFTCGRFTNDFDFHLFSWYPGTQSRPETIEEHAAACEAMGVIQFYVMPEGIPSFASASQAQDQAACFDDDSCGPCNPESDDAWFKPAISARLRALVTLYLSTLFRYKVPDAHELMYRIWKADDPVTKSDGISFWRAGVKWWESYQVALQPLSKDRSIHIIGETFSHNQGWSEGAVETAEFLLQEVLGMAGPSWLGREDLCKSNPFFFDEAE